MLLEGLPAHLCTRWDQRGREGRKAIDGFLLRFTVSEEGEAHQATVPAYLQQGAAGRCPERGGPGDW